MRSALAALAFLCTIAWSSACKAADDPMICSGYVRAWSAKRANISKAQAQVFLGQIHPACRDLLGRVASELSRLPNPTLTPTPVETPNNATEVTANLPPKPPKTASKPPPKPARWSSMFHKKRGSSVETVDDQSTSVEGAETRPSDSHDEKVDTTKKASVDMMSRFEVHSDVGDLKDFSAWIRRDKHTVYLRITFTPVGAPSYLLSGPEMATTQAVIGGQVCKVTDWKEFAGFWHFSDGFSDYTPRLLDRTATVPVGKPYVIGMPFTCAQTPKAGDPMHLSIRIPIYINGAITVLPVDMDIPPLSDGVDGN